MKLSKPIFTYTDKNDSFIKATFIKTIEYFTGRGALHQSYLVAQRLMAKHNTSFWKAAIEALKISLQYDQDQLLKIPKKGPLVVVANHPFGVIDGIIIGHLINKVRSDFKIMTNSMLCQAEDLAPFLLPIDFAPTKEAQLQNLNARSSAKKQVTEGKALILFPAGAVATTKGFTFKAVDAPWQVFTAELIHSGNATVVPLYFHGQNSIIFQWISQISLTLRLALLIYEASNKIGTCKKISIGNPIPYHEISFMKKRRVLVDYLRAQTLLLSKSKRAIQKELVTK